MHIFDKGMKVEVVGIIGIIEDVIVNADNNTEYVVKISGVDEPINYLGINLKLVEDESIIN